MDTINLDLETYENELYKAHEKGQDMFLFWLQEDNFETFLKTEFHLPTMKKFQSFIKKKIKENFEKGKNSTLKYTISINGEFKLNEATKKKMEETQ